MYKQHPFYSFWKYPKELITFDNHISDLPPGHITIQMHSQATQLSSKQVRMLDEYPLTSVYDQEQFDNEYLQDDQKDSIPEINIIPETRILNLPFNYNSSIWNLLEEEYINNETSSRLLSFPRVAYYYIKPMLPRSIQMSLRRMMVPQMAKRSFPRWPVDTSVETLHHRMMQLILKMMDEDLPMISFWPNGSNFCLVLTHDVETSIGFENIKLITDIERKHGFRSVWNFVPKRYKIDKNILDKLQENGFEVGVHGLYHDGKLFQSKDEFLKRAEEINNYLQEWNSVGFRSPSAMRKIDWISENININYDTSCPTTELYGAQPGGCCSVFPFIYGNMVELPITLQQDHTLLETLRITPEQMVKQWLETIQVIKKLNGLVLLIVHPDYLLSKERLLAYEKFLQIMKGDFDCWNALPRDAANWWQDRHDSQLNRQRNEWIIKGPASKRGRILKVGLDKKHPAHLSINPHNPLV